MKKVLCILILLTLHISVSAEEFFSLEYGKDPSHLTPIFDHFLNYDQRIKKLLFLTNNELGLFLSLPSFQAESAVSVYSKTSEASEKKYGDSWLVPDNKKIYFITVTYASDNIWFSMPENNFHEMKEKEISVKRTDRKISFTLAVAIQRAWAKMLLLTKHPKYVSNGNDGITYQFSVFVDGLGLIKGETWSPREGLPAEFVSLGKELINFTYNIQATEKKLIKKLKAFEEKVPDA